MIARQTRPSEEGERMAAPGYKCDPAALAKDLVEYFHKLGKEPRRECGRPWHDWEHGSTGIASPVVYALWDSKEDAKPLYVGQSTSFGPRLWKHLRPESTWKGGRPRYASYLDHDDFADPAVLSAFERFAIAVWEPENNDLRK